MDYTFFNFNHLTSLIRTQFESWQLKEYKKDAKRISLIGFTRNINVSRKMKQLDGYLRSDNVSRYTKLRNTYYFVSCLR